MSRWRQAEDQLRERAVRAEEREDAAHHVEELLADRQRARLEVHAGHGITYETVTPLAAFPEVMELNIGHFLIGEAIFVGLPAALAEMRRLMDEARA